MQARANEIVEVRSQEVDGEEQVMLVERQGLSGFLCQLAILGFVSLARAFGPRQSRPD